MIPHLLLWDTGPPPVIRQVSRPWQAEEEQYRPFVAAQAAIQQPEFVFPKSLTPPDHQEELHWLAWVRPTHKQTGIPDEQIIWAGDTILSIVWAGNTVLSVIYQGDTRQGIIWSERP